MMILLNSGDSTTSSENTIASYYDHIDKNKICNTLKIYLTVTMTTDPLAILS